MNRRLDSWKAIAEYLGRDAATARRWEKSLGLPVHRVAGGPGRSVFAYTEDIDAWLASSRSPVNGPAVVPAETEAPAPSADIVVAAEPSRPAAAGRSLLARAAMAAAGAVLIVVTAWWATSSRAAAAPLRFTVDERRIVALGEGGREQWRYEVPAGKQAAWPPFSSPARMASGDPQTVYVAMSYVSQIPDGPVDSGELMAFDGSGRRQRAFSFDDSVIIKGTTYGAPWAITDFATMGSGANERIAVAAHHYMWSPSVVTVLDAGWRRQGTFVNDGWIETLQWVSGERLIAGGFDQKLNGGLAALLDTSTMQAIRLVVMPRSEINLVTASRFNRAIIQTVNERVLVRTVEMPAELSQGAIDVIYEFTPSLDLLHASFSGRYWEMHRSLELQGKLNHSQANCPDRSGPRAIDVWEPATGWRHVAVTTP